MKCPACDYTLTPLPVGKITVDVCQGGCGGIWFDSVEVKKVFDPVKFEGAALTHIERNESLDSEVKVEGSPLMQIERDPSRVVNHERPRQCPKCSNIVMKRDFFSDKRRIQVDQCPQCRGVWLDAGELTMIREENESAEAKGNAAKAYLSKFLAHFFERSPD
jgi:Zn-finger nucleic acid-binding protein